MSTVSADQWLEAAAYRRTVYGLKGTSKVSDKRVEEIVGKVLSFAPSSYNTQPVRISIAFGEKHKALWTDIIAAAEPVLKSVGEEVWKNFSGILESHKGAYGSVIFWEDSKVIEASGVTHKSAAHMFGQFGDHTQGIHHILVWTALELEGLGANLQHLNAIPPVEAAIKKFAGVPDSYTLKAHLNFGDEPADHPKIPEKLPLSETLTIL